MLGFVPDMVVSLRGVQSILNLLKEPLTEEQKGWAEGAQQYTSPGFGLLYL